MQSSDCESRILPSQTSSEMPSGCFTNDANTDHNLFLKVKSVHCWHSIMIIFRRRMDKLVDDDIAADNEDLVAPDLTSYLRGIFP
ncbi:hypothetical protein N7475_002557 [Penicillium sp. IBT 31633x]|nr:hypothetical protein N7475_002557 [Penicillium sp. IBT 31633x]